MASMIKEYFGFEDDNIKMMLDTDKSTVKPTGKNIKVFNVRYSIFSKGVFDLAIFARCWQCESTKGIH